MWTGAAAGGTARAPTHLVANHGDSEAGGAGGVAAHVDAARGEGGHGLQHLALAHARVADDEDVGVAADGDALPCVAAARAAKEGEREAHFHRLVAVDGGAQRCHDELQQAGLRRDFVDGVHVPCRELDHVQLARRRLRAALRALRRPLPLAAAAALAAPRPGVLHAECVHVQQEERLGSAAAAGAVVGLQRLGHTHDGDHVPRHAGVHQVLRQLHLHRARNPALLAVALVQLLQPAGRGPPRRGVSGDALGLPSPLLPPPHLIFCQSRVRALPSMGSKLRLLQEERSQRVGCSYRPSVSGLCITVLQRPHLKSSAMTWGRIVETRTTLPRRHTILPVGGVARCQRGSTGTQATPRGPARREPIMLAFISRMGVMGS